MSTSTTEFKRAAPRPEQTFTTSPVKGFTSEVQLTQERNLYQKATVKQFTSEVNRPSLPPLDWVKFTSFTAPMSGERSEPVGSPVKVHGEGLFCLCSETFHW